MANFDKLGKQSKRGWDTKTGIQAIPVGQTAEISLFGGGPAPDYKVLEVSAEKPAICTIHERPLHPPVTNWRGFIITALQKGDTKIRAILPGTTNEWATMQVHVTGASGVRLVFFPGERLASGTTLGTIYVIGGKGEHFSAAGGAPVGYKDRGGHTAEPTPPGHYTLGPKYHVVTSSWPMSSIPFGASLRINAAGEVEFQGDSSGWQLATGRNGVVTKAQMAFKQRDGVKPDLATVIAQVRNIFIDPATGNLRFTTWEKNDFGRWGWNLRRNGQPTAYFVHTTPDDERNTALARAVFLANSHGCVHLKPAERDQMIASGYLKAGVDFEVRPYDETGPP